jgi:iron complex transport system substrate-binding protein
MRAFAWLWAASLAACAAPPPARVAGGGPPRRVVSLNLCTDELLLLLADPGQIAAVSHLAGRPEESPLAAHATDLQKTDGTFASAITARPDLVLTMGGGGDRLRIAERLGVRVIDLPFPQNLHDVVAEVRTVAGALGRDAKGEALVARLDALRRSVPAMQEDTIWIGTGGRTVSPDGLEAQWMALAGYRQRAIAGDRVQLEELLVRPPTVLLRSDYRSAQYSQGQAWLAHPLALAIRGGRAVPTDGRRWTCMGPLMIDEIARLRRERGA